LLGGHRLPHHHRGVRLRLIVAAAVCAWLGAGCSDSPAAPATPAARRLGLPAAAPPPSPSRAPGPARGFLLSSLSAVRAPDGSIELVAPLAGSEEGLEITWRSDRAALPQPSDDDRRVRLDSAGPGWGASATLSLGARDLAHIEAAPLPTGPVAASLAGGALIAWQAGDPPPHPTVEDSAVACSPRLLPGGREGCVVDAAVGALIRFGAGAVIAGAGPAPQGTPLQESPAECGDPRFPAPLAGGMIGCSEVGALNRHRRRPGAPRRPLQGLDVPLRPARTALSPQGEALSVATGRTLGFWRPRGATVETSSELRLLTRPALDGRWLTLPVDAGLQATEFGSGRRRQVGVRPAPDTVSAADGWVSFRETGGGWQLARIAEDAAGPWPVDTDRAWVIPGWRVATGGGQATAWGLRGQLGWQLPLDASFSPARGHADDLLALPFRSPDGVVGTVVLHVPTGLEVARWGARSRWVLPRGGDAAGLVVHVRAPGQAGSLERYGCAIRVIEEDRAGAPNRAGGHGGRHRLIPPGERAELAVHVADPSHLRAFRPQGPTDGWIEVGWDGGGTRVRASGEGWLDVAALPRDTAVTVAFVADPTGEGLVMDALLLQAPR
jgi:hypothetical protein